MNIKIVGSNCKNGMQLYKMASRAVEELEENIEVENEKVFKFVKKQGLQIHFDCSLSNDKDPAGIAKAAIKGTEVGKALFFSVTA